MRKISLVLMMVLCLSVPVFAAPIMDLDKGESAIDYSINRLDLDASGFGQEDTNFTDVNIGYGLTSKTSIVFGLDKFGDINSSRVGKCFTRNRDVDLEAVDIKLQHKLNDNLSIYAGAKSFTKSYTKTVIKNKPTPHVFRECKHSNDEDKAQFGLIYNKNIGNGFTGFASAGWGSGLKEYEVGLAKKISPDATLSVNYKNIDIDLDNDFNVKGDGFGFGLSVKF